MTAAVVTLLRVAERELTPGAVEPGTPGSVECAAPGCENWFVKRSGRHRYCKLEGCTYKRGAPPERELAEPEGAAEELLRRLQEAEEPEAGPAMYVERTRAIQEALRAGDRRAVWGALIDAAVVLVAWADRIANGEVPAELPAAQRAGAQRPAGLVQAVVASHRRTYALGERRVALVYELFGMKELVDSTELAVEQTAGSPQEREARVAQTAARARMDATERALQSVEAAWAERGHSLRELEGAAATTGAVPLSKRQGGGNGSTTE